MINHLLRRISALLLIVLVVQAPAVTADTHSPAGGAVAATTVIRQWGILRAAGLDPEERFGWSVALDDQTAVIGAPGDAGLSNTLEGAGVAYVFGRTATGAWAQQAILRPATIEAGDYFGASVAIAGDTVVIGASADDGATNSSTNSGAAYVFARRDGTWTQQAVLRPPAADTYDRFGAAVAIDGATVVIGAPLDDDPTTTLEDVGAAFVFTRAPNNTWVEQTPLRPAELGTNDEFGYSVSIAGDWIAVGAPYDDGVRDDTPDSGSVTVFRQQSGVWNRVHTVAGGGTLALDPEDSFGIAVAIDAGMLVVGASGDDGGTPSVTNAGAAYVFQYDAPSGGMWSSGTVLRAATPQAKAYLGSAVALDGTTIVAGAPGDDSPPLTDAGAAYVFSFVAPHWAATGVLRASSPAAQDRFGEAVALSGSQILIGAAGDDGSDNTVANSGAAYLYFRATSVLALPRIQR